MTKKINIPLIVSIFFLITMCSINLSFAEEQKTNPQNNQAATQPTVSIPDPALKKAINKVAGLSETADISVEKIEKITSLILLDPNIKSLTGLEQAKNLDYLYIQNTGVQDFSAITQLSQLNRLYIISNLLTDDTMPNLNELALLKTLNLQGTNYTPKSFVKFNQTPNLAIIFMENNKNINDISSLATLPNLRELILQFDAIHDFSVLKNFPKLNSLAATGQSTGNQKALFKTKKKLLTYNRENQTLFVPFTLMENRLTGFDGYQPPFSTSTASKDTRITLDGITMPSEQLSITDTGIFISGISIETYDRMAAFTYHTKMNNKSGSYPTPDDYKTYYLSSGTYYTILEFEPAFDINATTTISYPQDSHMTEEKFLTDIEAFAEGNLITSDFSKQIDFSTPGDYLVTLNSKNTADISANPLTITVTILSKPMITAKNSVQYTQNSPVTVETFLKDILAATNDGSQIETDFLTKVDFSKVGSYQVTLTAKSIRSTLSIPNPIVITVLIIKKEDPSDKPTDTINNSSKDKNAPKTPASKKKNLPHTDETQTSSLVLLIGLTLTIMSLTISWHKKH